MINWIKEGNIFSIDNVNNYAHGCNCAGAMGKGVALQFKHKYPDMYVQYKKLCNRNEFGLGDVFTYKHAYGYVFNLGTQKTWRTKAELNAIQQSLEKTLEFADTNNIKNMALPKIGAGLGGLDWEEVKKTIELVSSKYPNIILHVVENFKP